MEKKEKGKEIGTDVDGEWVRKEKEMMENR
jgi:hypothetical protein